MAVDHCRVQIPQEIPAFSQGMADKANADLHQRCPQLKPELGAPTPTQTGVPPLKAATAAVISNNNIYFKHYFK